MKYEIFTHVKRKGVCSWFKRDIFMFFLRALANARVLKLSFTVVSPELKSELIIAAMHGPHGLVICGI